LVVPQKDRAEMERDEHLRRGLPVSACLYVALCAVGGQSGAAEEMHYFADERGVPHFSNVPADPRYRLLLQSTPALGSDSTERPSVVLFAPPLVAPGSAFAVNVVLAAAADVYGWVDIVFNPEALTLVGASVEHEVPSTNVARLKVRGGASAEFSAELHFRANTSHGSSTSIELAKADLKTDGGKHVVTRKPPITRIAFISFGQ
jgi:hypothetical protein